MPKKFAKPAKSISPKPTPIRKPTPEFGKPAGEVNADKFILQDISPTLYAKWYSLAANWEHEYKLRLQTGIFDPWINPQTGVAYSPNAARYRVPYIKIQLVPKDSITNA